MTRASLILVLAVLAVGPVPIALHQTIDPGHVHDGGAAICSSDEHHDNCHVCFTLAGRTVDVAAVALASVAADLDAHDAAPGLTLADSPAADFARSRGPPVTLI